ncbi:MAG: hypothetical protein ACR2QV_13495 [Gammaproteobacteria bacterium]
MLQFAALVAALVTALVATSVTARAADLTTWTDTALAPYLAEQLTAHPRFRGETVVFVALESGRPAPVTNELALALRDRIVDAVIDRPGITIGWQTRPAGRGDAADSDCSRDRIHYFVGIEVVRLIDRRHRVTMRVLDAEEQSWVTGTAKSWEGRLTTGQRRAFEKPRHDEFFRGERDVPFTVDQTDMLATHLAHNLACALLQQVQGEYVIARKPQPDPALPLAGTIELVSNNLAGNAALRIATSSAPANSVLTGKAHRIVGDLYQYWATLVPADGSTPLPAVSASAYVRVDVPAAAPASTTVATPRIPTPLDAPRTDVARNHALLAPVRILEPRQRRSCYRAGSYEWKQRLVNADHEIQRGECFVLATRAHRNSTIFLLNFQVNDGLVALSSGRCGQSSTAVAARAGEELVFPSAGDPRPSASTWQGQQGVESFYAIAVTDEEARRDVAGLIDRLPSRCTLSPVDGLSGSALRQWLADFDRSLQRLQNRVDWQAVRIRHSL